MPHERSGAGCNPLSIWASSSRIGTLTATNAGTAASTPLTASQSVVRERWKTARHTAARTGIHMLSRVSDSSTIAATHGASQRGPRSQGQKAGTGEGDDLQGEAPACR